MRISDWSSDVCSSDLTVPYVADRIDANIRQLTAIYTDVLVQMPLVYTLRRIGFDRTRIVFTTRTNRHDVGCASSRFPLRHAALQGICAQVIMEMAVHDDVYMVLIK